MAFGESRVVEILMGVQHADPLHHGPRAQVAGGGEGDDLLQSRRFEADPQRACRSTFSGVNEKLSSRAPVASSMALPIAAESSHSIGRDAGRLDGPGPELGFAAH
ncbi:MAG: hypothetical protein LH617_04540, partial [Ramlibacter sp.]|nr:hypothetical protein [Ramlibacter sp.]